MTALLQWTAAGLYCPRGDFYIDPCRGVERALITHGHSDHARPGSKQYLTAEPGLHILRERLSNKAQIQPIRYGERLQRNGVTLSFHPAGHILGSAQIRLEAQGEVVVVSGDYKLQADPTCAPFEPVRCHTFISECTFGLPIYRWPEPQRVLRAIYRWWRENQQQHCTSVLLAYSLGKAQRILAGMAHMMPWVDGAPHLPGVLQHPNVATMSQCYRTSKVRLPKPERATPQHLEELQGRALLITPHLPEQPEWRAALGPSDRVRVARVSGWMMLRKSLRQSELDRGFILSDHADWDGLLEAIDLSQADQIWLTHGSAVPLARWLRQQGQCANILPNSSENFPTPLTLDELRDWQDEQPEQLAQWMSIPAEDSLLLSQPSAVTAPAATPLPTHTKTRSQPYAGPTLFDLASSPTAAATTAPAADELTQTATAAPETTSAGESETETPVPRPTLARPPSPAPVSLPSHALVPLALADATSSARPLGKKSNRDRAISSPPSPSPPAQQHLLFADPESPTGNS